MISEVFRNHDAAISRTSDWVPMKIELIGSNRFVSASTFEIFWENAIFGSDIYPIIKIECSEDGRLPIFVKNIAIDSGSNLNDALCLVVTQRFGYVRFVYTANSATYGKMNINIIYR
ncbi:MAG: hypothetical protein KIT33_08700 [Candidatus Kapabacteria bacterium]|nr:hypothetical protein [Ignavibacteriota bacterium]MCW5885034.1 hypothetical protein [Candidatus Kapabacteria bacterium]